MAESESSTPRAAAGLRLHSSRPAAQTGFSCPLLSNAQCSSPTASMKAPFSRSRKRPPSPELTWSTGSLSTFASAGKKPCSTFSTLSESKQPRTTLLNYYPYNKHGALPAHTALTSAITEADEDDLDEAVSSFRAPPGHIPHHDDVPRHVLQSRQPFSTLALQTHINTTSPYSSSAPGPLPNAGSCLPLSAADTPMSSSSSMPGYKTAQYRSGSRCTLTSYMPTAGVLYGASELDRDEQTTQVSLENSDQAEARRALGLVLKRHSSPSTSCQDMNLDTLQVNFFRVCCHSESLKPVCACVLSCSQGLHFRCTPLIDARAAHVNALLQLSCLSC